MRASQRDQLDPFYYANFAGSGPSRKLAQIDNTLTESWNTTVAYPFSQVIESAVAAHLEDRDSVHDWQLYRQ